MKTIEDYLRNWRADNNFTQEQAADRLCVSQSTYNKWERGKSAVPSKHYAAIAKMLAVI
jgi:transcriptional regulator with XRE-family HTH domain